MLEGKAGALMRLLADVDGAAQMRDEEARQAGEQQLGAFVKTGTARTRERESAQTDVPNNTSPDTVAY
ncbi:hypothetical protein GPECTOR_77g3 [Gonium pectorale]|uniref:Uncharacterized protein n=1 Tax=Gonium pectorale TaxID=33097 RepID=A0A150G278_GONPE|nr:hypothetical protein GPECTOR_77g3 [Gonium pectorale]|eukprot:KXZ43933.1 hypothetical protein GPECTOR_77g3 [Gonium pectorale]